MAIGRDTPLDYNTMEASIDLPSMDMTPCTFTVDMLFEAKEMMQKADRKWRENLPPLVINKTVEKHALEQGIDIDVLARSWGYNGYKICQELPE